MYINSPGGSVTSAMAMLDTMNHIKPDVATVCVGMAASAGAVLLAAGAPGKRAALPNAEIMIHQPWGGAQGQATDIEITAKQILKTRDRLNKILAKATGQDLKTIEKDVETRLLDDVRRSQTNTASSTMSLNPNNNKKPTFDVGFLTSTIFE